MSKISTLFRWEYGGYDVYICGNYDGWISLTPMTLSGGEFLAIIDLEEGRHEFKFFVDDEWCYDPKVEYVADRHFGNSNVIYVSSRDRDVVESLDLDCIGCEKDKIFNTYIDNNNENFAQNIPDLNELNDLEFFCPVSNSCTDETSMENCLKRNTLYPPILPTHSLSCVLNGYKKYPIPFEESLELGIPDSTTLRHVYTMTLNEETYALALSRRYRNKSTTTLFIKPIPTMHDNE